MYVLGIESSCDDTGVGIVSDSVSDAAAPSARLIAHMTATQLEEHRPYGGVVPEIAARAHLDKIDATLRATLDKAGLSLSDITAIAATTGPGLIGGVMVGAMTGKALASVCKKPFIGVNHLEGHALTARLSHDIEFPYLLLLVSGGHCQLLLVEGVSNYTKLGSTRDDAVGECFDKSAKLLGLGYPGGPRIEEAAKNGNPKSFELPHPMQHRDGCDFSFSGLKTAVRLQVQKQEKLTDGFVADMAASLQSTIAEILQSRTSQAFKILEERNIFPTALVVGGGVGANKAIRAGLTNLAETKGVPFLAPPIELCTDNGVMIAWAGLERYRLGLTDGLDLRARPRWPLEELKERIVS